MSSDLTSEQILDELGRVLGEFDDNHRKMEALVEQMRVKLGEAAEHDAAILRALDEPVVKTNA